MLGALRVDAENAGYLSQIQHCRRNGSVGKALCVRAHAGSVIELTITGHGDGSYPEGKITTALLCLLTLLVVG
jgi:hypothetical protein